MGETSLNFYSFERERERERNQLLSENTKSSSSVCLRFTIYQVFFLHLTLWSSNMMQRIDVTVYSARQLFKGFGCTIKQLDHLSSNQQSN